MSKLMTSKPSYVFGYWRPWNEDSKMIDSYLDYTRDTSLVKYGADTLGKYINQASKEQVQAINHLGETIGRGLNVLSNQMLDINDSLMFLNRNLDIQIEQQKLSNLLLQNIADLLRIPNSEKERQHSIELGIKFFVNASKDADLYADSLEELLKAESLMKQDYFVLHRIGCIYLYVKSYINPEMALDYFVRAAKYASVESDSNAARLANALTSNFNTVNSKLNKSDKNIRLLASDSYEKAAFAAYVLGRFDQAELFQQKALELGPSAESNFLLAKYTIRNGRIKEGVKFLDIAISLNPKLELGVFKELDLISELEVRNLLKYKNADIDSKIIALQDNLKSINSLAVVDISTSLNSLLKETYEVKVARLHHFENEGKSIIQNIISLQNQIDNYLGKIKKRTFCTLKEDGIQNIIKEFTQAKSFSYEKMKISFDKLTGLIEEDTLRIGAKCAGGIVFYLNESKRLGLVYSEKGLGEAPWGNYRFIRAYEDGIANGSGISNTKRIVEKGSSQGLFNLKRMNTAARLCLESRHNGYNDWYLPTIDELKVLYENISPLKNFRIKSFGCVWSSEELYNILGKSAAYYDLKNGKAETNIDFWVTNKIYPHNVIAIRIFKF